MRIKRNISRLLAILALAAFVPGAVGCFGGYNLTRNFYNWNKNVSDNKWVVWLIHIPVGMVMFFPVLLDAWIFNSIEFYSGDNPINLSDANTLEGPNGVVAEFTPRSEGVVDVVVTEQNGDRHDVTLVRDAKGVTLFDDQGRLIAQREL